MKKKIIIVGGGVSGLVSAIYARHNQFDVTLYEKNYGMGGCCCGWNRKGNYIDGCIHWLQGSKDDNSVASRIWRTCDAVDNDSLIYPHSFLDFDIDGVQFHWYTNLVELKAEMLRVAPEDKRMINKLFKMLKTYIDFPLPVEKPSDMMNLFELLGVAKRLAIKYMKMTIHSGITIEDWGKQFKSPILRYAFKNIMPPKYNLMSGLYMMGVLGSNDGGIPVGGSQAMADRMTAKAKSLGAVIKNNCGVDEIIVEDNEAIGVKLANGEVDYADYVISTTDATHTLDKLLGGKFPVKDFTMRNNDVETYPIYTYTLAVLKVNADVSKLPHDAVIKGNFDMGTPVDALSFRNYAYDSTLKGKDGSTIMQACVMGLDEMYDYWQQVRSNGKYAERKAEVGEEFRMLLEEYYPELAGKVEVIDVVTPLTYERYLNTRHGTFQGYIGTPKSKPLTAKNYIPKLKNFVLGGQWLMRSGGLPPAAFYGRFAVQRICKWAKVKYVDPNPAKK